MATGEISGSTTERVLADGPPNADPQPLDNTEGRQLDVIRRFGTVGALLMAVGSLGASASPVFNPLTTVPVLSLFVRMPTVALACAFSGTAMVLLAWLWLGRYVRPGRTRLLSRSQLNRTLVMWATPLAIAPPMFSRDVYSYLAQSKIAALGLDPYRLGPATALGVADPLTRGVPTIWRDTPAPYGPLFIGLGRGITALVGNHVVTGVYLQRLLELIGLAMIVWALPRLAQRFGVQPVSALWLGAANPLVLWHLVSGSHNEALMIGLMLAGFEIALRALPSRAPDQPASPPTKHELLVLLVGAAIITLGAAVKISALPALGFLGVAAARHWGARLRHLLAATLLMIGVCAVILVATSMGTGLGFGWLATLNTNGVVKSWQSPVSALGYLAGGLGIMLGLGNHTDTTISVMGLLGELISGLIIIKLLWDVYRGRQRPMLGLGLGLGAFVVLSATVQPWYLLWAIIPLAAAIGTSRFRTIAATVSAAYAVISPLPTGSTPGASYVAVDAYLAAVVVLAVTLFFVRKRIPILSRPRRPVTEPSP